MTLLKEFRQRTYDMAQQMNKMKVSTLRLAEAKSRGYRTVKSYEAHLSELDLNSHLFTDSDSLVWMTNSLLESCFDPKGEDAARFFRGLGLSYQEIPSHNPSAFGTETEFYPLTKEEERLITADNVEFANDWSFEFFSTAIVNGKKHLAVVYREYFENDTDEEEHTRAFLKLQVERLKAPMLNVAQALNGKLQWSNEPSWYDAHQGDFELTLFVPFESVLGKASNSEEYVEMVCALIKQETNSICR